MKKTLLIFILVGILINISADPILLPQKDGHIFSNLKDEYKIVSYYLNTFWEVQDPNLETECNEFLLEVITRIKYSNRHFSHFKEGWKTDMGKIYIKYGEPFEIIELTNTGPYVKLALREYQIWKYRISIFQTFLFIDPQQHRDFRLIFSDGYTQEGSWKNYKDYLGTNFDATLLN